MENAAQGKTVALKFVLDQKRKIAEKTRGGEKKNKTFQKNRGYFGKKAKNPKTAQTNSVAQKMGSDQTPVIYPDNPTN